jgi:hypothetical protein
MASLPILEALNPRPRVIPTSVKSSDVQPRTLIAHMCEQTLDVPKIGLAV